MAGRLVVRPLWGQCGLEGSFTNHSSAAISQSEMISPLGRIQSSAVLLVQVPVCGEATYQANVKPWHLSSTGSVCPTGWPRGQHTKAKPTSAAFSQGPNTRQCHSDCPQRKKTHSWETGAHTQSCPPRKEPGVGGLTTLALCVVAKQAVGQPDGERHAIVGDLGTQPGDVYHKVDARLVYLQPILLVGQSH